MSNDLSQAIQTLENELDAVEIRICHCGLSRKNAERDLEHGNPHSTPNRDRARILLIDERVAEYMETARQLKLALFLVTQYSKATKEIEEHNDNTNLEEHF